MTEEISNTLLVSELESIANYQICNRKIVEHFLETKSFGKTLQEQIAILLSFISTQFGFNPSQLPNELRQKSDKKTNNQLAPKRQ